MRFSSPFQRGKGKKKKKKNKFREWLKIKLWNALWYCWVRHIRASVWSKVYFEYCATQNDTLEEVWCSVGGCLNQQTRHAAASARVVCGGVPFQAQARATSITHNALRICIMHQQALNIKLWMRPKILRVVYVEKMALCCGSNLLTFCEAEQSGSCMVLHYWAPYAITVNRLKSPSLECLHVLILALRQWATYHCMFVNVHSYSFKYSLIHSFYCKYCICMHKQHFKCTSSTHISRLNVA